jgi:hypothetical protein
MCISKERTNRLVLDSLQGLQAIQLFGYISVSLREQIASTQPLSSRSIELSHRDVTNVPARA